MCQNLLYFKQSRISGCPFGSNAHFVLLDALLSNNIKEEDVEPVKLNPTEMIDVISEQQKISH